MYRLKTIRESINKSNKTNLGHENKGKHQRVDVLILVTIGMRILQQFKGLYSLRIRVFKCPKIAI